VPAGEYVLQGAELNTAKFALIIVPHNDAKIARMEKRAPQTTLSEAP
jgi:hypothetical protein